MTEKKTPPAKEKQVEGKTCPWKSHAHLILLPILLLLIVIIVYFFHSKQQQQLDELAQRLQELDKTLSVAETTQCAAAALVALDEWGVFSKFGSSNSQLFCKLCWCQ